MKTLSLFFTLLLASSLAAHAQLYQAFYTGGTNVIAGSTIRTSTAPVIVLRNARVVTVQQTFKLHSGSETEAVASKIELSANGSSWVDYGDLYTTAAGTSIATSGTNMDVGGYLFLRVHYTTNNNTAILTNLLIDVTAKLPISAYSGSTLTPIDVLFGGTSGSNAHSARLGIWAVGSTNGYATNFTVVTSETNLSLTASYPMWSDSGKKVVSVSPSVTRTNIGVQTGTCITTTDGTVTNAFVAAFSAVPVVVSSQIGIDTTTTNIIEATTTNFVLNCGEGAADITNQWIAIGAP